MSTQAEREKFARRLQSAGEIRAKAETIRQERESSRQTNRETVAASTHETEAQTHQPERLGRMLVEAPAILLTGANIQQPERGISASKEAVRAVNFNKKVEDYTTPELKQAAEKIRMDGTTLKEMWDSGRLDERALKRVMKEFVEGRSVRAALNKELLEEELRYERDPQLRDKARQRVAGQQAGAGAGGTALKAAVGATGAAMLLRNMKGEPADRASGKDAGESFGQNTGKPQRSSQSSQSIFEKVREEPKMQMAAAGAVIVVLAAALLIFL
jgi:hypothetical protein